jgi:dimethylhistidine N-methyltransferase
MMKTSTSQATYKPLNSADYSESFDEIQAFALDVLVGLTDPRKYIPSKYIYDAEGSRLFIEITNLPEYYPFNCEIDVLTSNLDRIVASVEGQSFNLVELGAGSARKTSILLERFCETGIDLQYVPIDISESAMSGLVERVGDKFPDLVVNGLVSDYFTGLKYLNNRFQRKNLVLFLGSSIGNFTGAQARVFMKNVWSCLNNEDKLLIGFDMKKDIEKLLYAYNDPKGITARFNLNLLHRINRELGGEFDVGKFRHFGTYDVFSGAMESYLVSLEDQDVFIKEIGRSFHFRPWEPIHTEYSYKYLLSDISDLAADTGFKVEENLFESRNWFVDSIWNVHKPRRTGG